MFRNGVHVRGQLGEKTAGEHAGPSPTPTSSSLCRQRGARQALCRGLLAEVAALHSRLEAGRDPPFQREALRRELLQRQVSPPIDLGSAEPLLLSCSERRGSAPRHHL